MVKIDLQQGNCLELMKNIPDESIDLILCDPPYGTIKGLNIDGWKNKTTDWDNQLSTNKLFEEYERILKTNCPIILFSQEPYTSLLRIYHSYSLYFAYPMIWEKSNWSNPFLVKKKPLNVFEDISVFYKKYDNKSSNSPLRKYSRDVWEFIKTKRNLKNKSQINKILKSERANHFFRYNSVQIDLPTEKTYQILTDEFELNKMKGYLKYDELKQLKHKRIFNAKKAIKNIFHVPKENNNLHPTQKPINLLEQLIKLYSDKGMTVLDNCMGSGSTGVACINTERNFIGMELDKKYFEIAKNRIVKAEERES